MLFQVEEIGCNIDDKKIDLSYENEFDFTVTDSALAVQLLDEDERGAYGALSKGITLIKLTLM